MCLFTFKQIVPRLIELDDVISYKGGAANGSCLGRWNGLRRPWSRVPCERLARQVLLATPKGVRKRGVGVNLPLSLIFYENCITCAKEINCFRILFAC